MTGLNILSGADDWLGAALTSPTELARKKGKLADRYGLLFNGRAWPDVEFAYHALKTINEQTNNQLMVELIAAKLQQHLPYWPKSSAAAVYRSCFSRAIGRAHELKSSILGRRRPEVSAHPQPGGRV